ncbi:hypothetical protein FHX52_3249 [Humibacillus xanthopallidus]|uniref:Uncharacterized protein n=1 Tax=Humibacillus xanthopallidus TaxID=412689 RepID=A0A543PR26_9MICO|nr:hypothetical protein FHX52_3249 [Humibacillus xanthopallidus]
MRHPVDSESRRRLLAAQRAETEALRSVEAASRSRQRAQEKLDAAEAEFRHSQAQLVQISGLARAALLLDEDESTLRRWVRSASRDGMSSRDSEA